MQAGSGNELMLDMGTAAIEVREDDFPAPLRETVARFNPQALALIRCLAGDMPLRMASTEPTYGPHISGAAMRLRRFVSFYPQFSGAALFTQDGRMIANTTFATCGEPFLGAPFHSEIAYGHAGELRSAQLAAKISALGSDDLVYAGVACPKGCDACGIVVARLR